MKICESLEYKFVPTMLYHENGNYCDNGLARLLAFDRLVESGAKYFLQLGKTFCTTGNSRGCFNTCAFCVSGEKNACTLLILEMIRARIAEIHRHEIRNPSARPNFQLRTIDGQKHYFSYFVNFPDICTSILEIDPACFLGKSTFIIHTQRFFI